MTVLELVSLEAGEQHRRIFIAATLAGGTNALVLSLANKAAETPGNTPAYIFILFAICILIYGIGARFTYNRTAEIVQSALLRIKNRIVDKVERAELEQLERIGASKINDRITENMAEIADSAGLLANLLQSLWILIFATLYLLWVSVPAFVLTSDHAGIERVDPWNGKMNTIKIEDVGYVYAADNGHEPFRIGPVNLEIRSGEILFIVGGNGSGKSTFLKVRTPKLYGVLDADPAVVHYLLVQMRVNDKTSFESGSFTKRKLSTGQRKRLAMIVTLLEDRPICVFDEWAADQDPIFRKYFYDELLPILKNRGKTVIAVSHDHRYFHYADRVLTMDEGKIRSVTENERAVVASRAEAT